VSKTRGNPAYAKPVVLVLYGDHKSSRQVLPRRGAARPDYDLVIARNRTVPAPRPSSKASKVLAPLARSLAPGGRMIAIIPTADPGLEIVQRVCREKIRSRPIATRS